MDFGVTFQTDPPREPRGRAHAARRGARLRARVDVRLPHPVAGALRHLRADAGGDRADHGRPVRDQPGDARPDGDRVAVRHAQRQLRQPHDLRHRPRRLRAPRARQAADDAGARPRRRSTSSRSWPRGGAIETPARRGARSRGCATASSTCGWRATGRRRSRSSGRKADGFILQLADPVILRWTVDARARGRGGGGPRPGLRSRSASPRPPTSATTWRTRASSAAGSAGWSATTSPTSSAATARAATSRPR